MEKIQKEFIEKYSSQSQEFFKKYADKLKDLQQGKSGSAVTIAMVEEYLIGQKIEFSNDEKTFLVAMKEYNNNPLIQSQTAFNAKYKTQLSQFNTDHQGFLTELSTESRMVNRNENIQKMLHLPLGFATDIMTSQDICRSIVSEMTPISADKMKSNQSKITTPFIASYMELKNKETNAKIQANKTQKGSIVNQVPKTEGDKLFNAIISKYKGKVVYVDFWATWCAPCLEGIKMIKPLKEEMANENIAFVYITGETSPKKTYDNMIPSIKGEHYRVSGDEWNFICGKFGISGIPHYMLIGKDGNIINPNFGHLENEQLKSRLMKYIKE